MINRVKLSVVSPKNFLYNVLLEGTMDKFFTKYKFFKIFAGSILCIYFSFYPAKPIQAAEIPYGTGSWDTDKYGNHRVVIHVAEKTDAVLVHIPWRRRDSNPEKKNIILIDAKTQSRIKNMCPVNINQEFGDLVFQPVTAPGDTYVYYRPYQMSGRSNYPTVVYPEPEHTAGPLKMELKAKMEFDGFVQFRIKLEANQTTDVSDIYLKIPVVKDAAKYIMGMGLKGGVRPDRHQWKWDREKNQDSIWVGDVNAGFQCSLRAENYSRPLNTNFYLSKPLRMPPSWYNKGKGGCTIHEENKTTVLVKATSGQRTIKKGETLYFNFNLLLTPFKTLDTKGQWSTRFFHAYKPIDEIKKTGANTINNHHANNVNPYINYPFIHTKEMKNYVDTAHKLGLKVKIYNTIRELSNRAAEIFALRSLGHEIFSPGSGGGFSWLQEHIGSDYIAAWFVPKLKDAAIINSGMSRWHNYYLEGLNWLVQNIGIDGLYIDDVAYDRTTMKRVRKILNRGRGEAIIDLHSANQFNPRDGFINSANLYMEHFPYLNRLWFGEYFDYDSSPDFWLTEVSGIPFGLMGEMLQDGGNPWRGMIYGMTSRLPWAGNPTPVWKVWDDFGIQDSRMVGYWSPTCPIRTDQKEILATAYIKNNSVLIAIASWAEDTVNCRLKIDWKKLGIDKDKAQLKAPSVKDFQEKAVFKPEEAIPVEPGKGWLLILNTR